MTGVEKRNELREAFDKMIDEYGICMLSSPSIVSQARELEELLAKKK